MEYKLLVTFCIQAKTVRQCSPVPACRELLQHPRNGGKAAEGFLCHTQLHGTKSHLDITVEDPLPGYRPKTYILSQGMLNCSSLDAGYGTLVINKRQLLKSRLNTLCRGWWWLQSQNRFASLHFYFLLTFPFGQRGWYPCHSHIPASQPQPLP